MNGVVGFENFIFVLTYKNSNKIGDYLITNKKIKMRKIVSLLMVCFLLTSTILAKDKFTLQLKWVTQAQFMGYFVAQDKGFYKAENLDVTIKPGGPDIAPPQIIAGGGADVLLEWMPAALAAKEKGVDLVNVAQIFKKSGLMLTCRKDTKITTPSDFRGRTIGVWFFGNEYPFLSWMGTLGIPTNGGARGVKVLKQGFNVDPLIQKQADCISTMTYNEYWQVIDAGYKPSELITFKYEEQKVATLEDGIYVLSKNLKNKKFVDKLTRFVRASIKGWKYAIDNQAEAVQIVLDNDDTGAQTKKHQTRMAKEIARLVQGSDIGYLNPDSYERTVDVLLSSKSTPVITKRPKNAWTHSIWNKL